MVVQVLKCECCQYEGLVYHLLRMSNVCLTVRIKFCASVVFFDVFSTVHHSIELFHLPTLMHNSLFINNMYVTLLSSTCFEH